MEDRVNTIHEFPILKDHFEEKGLIVPNGIGVAGTSMGGIVTLGALDAISMDFFCRFVDGEPYIRKICSGPAGTSGSIGV